MHIILQKNIKDLCLDGRDIITIQVKDAMFKFYITASLKVRAKRRFNEYKNLNKKYYIMKCSKALEIGINLIKKKIWSSKKNKRFYLD